MNPFFFAADLAAGRLVQIFDLVVKADRSYWLVYPKARRRSAKIQAFVAWLLAEAARRRRARGGPPGPSGRRASPRASAFSVRRSGSPSKHAASETEPIPQVEAAPRPLRPSATPFRHLTSQAFSGTQRPARGRRGRPLLALEGAPAAGALDDQPRRHGAHSAAGPGATPVRPRRGRPGGGLRGGDARPALRAPRPPLARLLPAGLRLPAADGPGRAALSRRPPSRCSRPATSSTSASRTRRGTRSRSGSTGCRAPRSPLAEALGVPEARTTIALYRIPSLLGALATVLLTYWAALAFLGRRGAFLAAALMAASILLMVEARLAKTDAVLAACVRRRDGRARPRLSRARAGGRCSRPDARACSGLGARRRHPGQGPAGPDVRRPRGRRPVDRASARRAGSSPCARARERSSRSRSCCPGSSRSR